MLLVRQHGELITKQYLAALLEHKTKIYPMIANPFDREEYKKSP